MERQFRFNIGMGSTLFMAMILLSLSVTFHVNGRKLADKEQLGFRADLVHVDSPMSPFSPGNISFSERMQRAIYRSKQRLQKDIETSVFTGSGEFLMNLAIGTPALPYYAILDTGSDLTWTQCEPCTDCYPQPTPIYDPSNSSTYSKLPCQSPLCISDFQCTNASCEYDYAYADSSITTGIISYETFTFASKYGTKQSIPHIAFGCSRSSEGNSFSQGAGIVGFGRGPLSLISQLASSIPNKFSYCLLPVQDSQSKTSPLMFGEAAKLSGKVPRSTPLIKNSHNPTFYYLALEGISVGSNLLDIRNGTFDIRSDGTGGLIIDSGTTVTILDSAAYNVLRLELVSLIKLPIVVGDLDLCYNPQSGVDVPNFPTVTFHFEGADYPLPKENYMITDSNGFLCLGMLPNPGMSVFGNVQQQNFHILFDVENELLSFEPAVCDSI